MQYACADLRSDYQVPDIWCVLLYKRNTTDIIVEEVEVSRHVSITHAIYVISVQYNPAFLLAI